MWKSMWKTGSDGGFFHIRRPGRRKTSLFPPGFYHAGNPSHHRICVGSFTAVQRGFPPFHTPYDDDFLFLCY